MPETCAQGAPQLAPAETIRSTPATVPPARTSWAHREGLPLPLGVRWIPDDRAYNFALYSKHAQRVVLLLFRADDLARPALSVDLDYLQHKSGRVWHCRVTEEQLKGARFYGYSVAGPPPAGQFEWHAFDPDKVLLDPYADAVYFPSTFDGNAAAHRGSDAGRGPLGVIPPPTPANAPTAHATVAPSRPAAHESDAVIYELHVRNFTRHPASDVAPDRRGTFAGVIDKIPYLVDLGVTIVEQMPVFQFDPGGAGRWGYMPLSFFALHNEYLSEPDPAAGHQEFRRMVDALHDAGIEVILDVVYNHTCEGGIDGPVYSYKGIDNSTYYLMTGDSAKPYADYSGTGNTMNCANRAVRKMILDSMRHWVRLGVDGFRFDLASIYARDAAGTIRYDDPPIFGEISADPEFSRIRLIAEPWDAAVYQLGRGFPGSNWHQWNGAFRDDVRRFVRGDLGMVGTLMARLYGSDDLFPADRMNAYRPAQSVNYVTCHDGPTLYDLVSYNHKYNWANGHGNTDGPAQNFGWNCGWEGDVHVPDDVAQLRLQQAKNLISLVFLSNGTPMLRAGDEFLHTQLGNDNQYNQDNETTWLDWGQRDRSRDMLRFVTLMIAFRKAHPSLCRSRFWRDDVRWYGPGAAVDLTPLSQSIAYCLHGASEGDTDIYVMINGSQEPLTFVVQEGPAEDWLRVVDTSRASPDDVRAPKDEAVLVSSEYTVAPRSVVVLTRLNRIPYTDCEHR
jgi:isoamylase